MRFLCPLVLGVLVVLSGCGGDGGDGNSYSSIAPPGRFWLNPPIIPGGPNPPAGRSVEIGFTATQNSAPPDRTYVGVGWTNDVYITKSQSGAMFSSDMVTWDNSGNASIAIVPDSPTEVGTFTGTITVNGCSRASLDVCVHVADSPKTVNVTYTVHGLSITPAQLAFSSTGSNLQTQTATLSVTGGSPSYTWAIDYSPTATNWLQVRPASGTADLSNGLQTVELTANAAGVPAGVHAATITFNAGESLRAPLTVTLSVGAPSVNFIAPYVVPAGSSGGVTLRGRGFSALGPDSLSVRFDFAPAASAVVVNDSEIRATYPPLAAGSYSISVGSAGTSIPSRAALKLVVIDPPRFPFTSIARPTSANRPQNLIYDAERQALLFTDPANNNRILRYALPDKGAITVTTGSYVGRIALSPDGTQLLRGAPDASFTIYDPVTLTPLSSVDSSGSIRLMGAWTLAFANDGGAIFGGLGPDASRLFRYDMLTRSFIPFSFHSNVLNRHLFASADGSTLVLPRYTTLLSYEASTGALTQRPLVTTWFRGTYMSRGLSLDRTGSRILVADLSPTQSTLDPFQPSFNPLPMRIREQTTVYDAGFNTLGTLPDGAMPFVLSPQGDFAYGYYPTEGRVRKFSVASNGVTEVGSGRVVAPANTEMSEMTISPDGGTLFLVGTTSVVISPAP